MRTRGFSGLWNYHVRPRNNGDVSKPTVCMNLNGVAVEMGSNKAWGMGLSVWNECSVHSWTGATRGGGCGCAGVGEGAICTLPSVPHHLKPFPNLTAAVPPPLPMLKPREIRKKQKRGTKEGGRLSREQEDIFNHREGS